MTSEGGAGDGTARVHAVVDGYVLAVGVGIAVSAAVGSERAGAFSVAGSGAGNILRTNVRAGIERGNALGDPVFETSGALSVRAIDTTRMVSAAAAIGLSLASGDKLTVGLAAGVSVAINEAGVFDDLNEVSAFIDDVSVKASKGISVEAVQALTIAGVAVGIAASGAVSSNGPAIGLSGAGAFTFNTVESDVSAKATSTTGTVLEAGGSNGDIRLTAIEASVSDADAGGLALAVAWSSSSSTGALGAGVGVARTDFDVGLSAHTDGVSIKAGRDITVEAHVLEAPPLLAEGDFLAYGIVDPGIADQSGNGPRAKIDTVAFSGALSAGVSTGSGLTGSLALAGSVAVNRVDLRTRAYIADAPRKYDVGTPVATVGVNAGGSVTVEATDRTSTRADAGGVALSLAVGKDAAVAGSVGLSIADNRIGLGEIEGDDPANYLTEAYIRNSSVDAGEAVTVRATAITEFESVSIGGAGSVAAGFGSGSATIALAGAGASAVNYGATHVSAGITSENTAETAVAGGDVIVRAIDRSEWLADAGGVAVAIAAGLGGGGVTGAGSFGAGRAENRLTSAALATIRSVDVTASGDVTVEAISGGVPPAEQSGTGPDNQKPGIRMDAMALGGAGSGAFSGSGLSIALAASVVVSINELNQETVATVEDALIESRTGNATVRALDESALDSDAGGTAVALSVSVKGNAGAGSLGAAFSTNDMDGTVHADVLSSQIEAKNDVTVEALTRGLDLATKTLTSDQVDAGTDIITITDHGFADGDRVQLRRTSTGETDGVAGLKEDQLYVVDLISSDSFYLLRSDPGGGGQTFQQSDAMSDDEAVVMIERDTNTLRIRTDTNAELSAALRLLQTGAGGRRALQAGDRIFLNESGFTQAYTISEILLPEDQEGLRSEEVKERDFVIRLARTTLLADEASDAARTTLRADLFRSAEPIDLGAGFEGDWSLVKVQKMRTYGLGIAGSVAVAGGFSLAASGAGSDSRNLMDVSTVAQVQGSHSGIPAGEAALHAVDGDVTVRADDMSALYAESGGFSVAVSVALDPKGGAGALAFGGSVAKNEIGMTRQAAKPNVDDTARFSTFKGSDIGNGTLTVANHGLEEGDRVYLRTPRLEFVDRDVKPETTQDAFEELLGTVDPSDQNVLIDGIDFGRSYYVTEVSGNTFRLARTEADARSASPDTISFSGGGIADGAAFEIVGEVARGALPAAYVADPGTRYAELRGAARRPVQETRAIVEDAAILSGGAVDITATTRTTAVTRALVGGVSVAVSLSFSGGLVVVGAKVDNIVRSGVEATVRGTASHVDAAGAVRIRAEDQSQMVADGGAFAVAIGVALGGSGAGLGLAAGFAKTSNFAAVDTVAIVDRAWIDAGGDLAVAATADAAIGGYAFGGAGAAGGGYSAGIAVAGSGARSGNYVFGGLQARIEAVADRSATQKGITAANVSVSALDTSKIEAKSDGGSAAVGGGLAGVAITVALVDSVNTISRNVSATVHSSNIDVGAGVVSLDARTTGDSGIDVEALSAAISVAGGYGGLSFSLGGALAFNRIDNTVTAEITGTGHTVQAGDLRLNAEDRTRITSDSDSYAVSVFGGFAGGGVAVGVTFNINKVSTRVRAATSGITADVGAFDMRSRSASAITADGLAVSVVAAGGLTLAVAGAGADARSIYEGTVTANAGGTIRTGGDVTVEAASANDVRAASGGSAIAIGLVGAPIGISDASTTVTGTVKAILSANVEGLDGTGPNDIHVTAVDVSYAGANADALSGGALSIGFAGAKTVVSLSPTVTALVETGRIGSETLPIDGDLIVTAQSLNDAQALARGRSYGLVAISRSESDLTVTPEVLAEVTAPEVRALGDVRVLALNNYRHERASPADDWTFSRTSGRAYAEGKSPSGGLFAFNADSDDPNKAEGAIGDVTVTPTITAKVATGGVMDIGGDFDIVSLSAVDAEGYGLSRVEGLAGDGSARSQVRADGAVTAQFEKGDATANGRVSVLASAAHGADATAEADPGGLVWIRTNVLASTQPTVTAAVGDPSLDAGTGTPPVANLAATTGDMVVIANAPVAVFGKKVGPGVDAGSTPPQADSSVELVPIIAGNASATAGGSFYFAGLQERSLFPSYDTNDEPETGTVTLDQVVTDLETRANNAAPVIAVSAGLSLSGTGKTRAVDGLTISDDQGRDSLRVSLVGGADADLFEVVTILDPGDDLGNAVDDIRLQYVGGEIGGELVPDNDDDGIYEVFLRVQDRFGGSVLKRLEIPRGPAAILGQTEAPADPGGYIDQAALESVVAAARARWQASGLSQAQADRLDALGFSVENLRREYLAVYEGDAVIVDISASGQGWFVDATPMQDEEFTPDPYVLTATGGQARARVDLLTVVMHEMGHAIGLDHADREQRGDLMLARMLPGERRLPGINVASGATPDDGTGTHAVLTPTQVFGSRVSTLVTGGDGESGALPVGLSTVVNISAISNPVVRMSIGEGALLSAGSVDADGNLFIGIDIENSAVAEGGGAAINAIAIGSVNAYAEAGGTIDISLQGRIEYPGDLTLQLDTSSTAIARGESLAVGLGAGIGVRAVAKSDPTVNLFVEDGADIVTGGDFTIRTVADSIAYAQTKGIAVSYGLSIGVALTEATNAPNITTYVGENARVTAGGDITVETRLNADETGAATGGGAFADAQSSSGAIYGAGSGARAAATNTGVASAEARRGTLLGTGQVLNLSGAGGAQDGLYYVTGVSGDGADVSVEMRDWGGALEAGTLDAASTTLGTAGIGALDAAGLDRFAVTVAGGTATLTALDASGNALAGFFSALDDETDGTVTIRALADHTARAKSFGLAIGGLSVGASLSYATSGGTTQAWTSGSVTAGALLIEAESRDTAIATPFAAAGGIVSGSGAEAKATILSRTLAFIGAGPGEAASQRTISVGGALTVRAIATPTALARSEGFAVGAGLGVGVQLSEITLTPVVSAYLGANTKILGAGSVSVLAETRLPGAGEWSADALSTGASGGLIGVNATLTEVTSAAEVAAEVFAGVEVTGVTGNVTVVARSDLSTQGEASGKVGGLIAAGANPATSAIANETVVRIGDAVLIEAGGAFVAVADAVEDTRTRARAGSGGVIAGAAANATAIIESRTGIDIGRAEITVRDISLRSEQETSFDTNADSVSAAVVGKSGAFTTSRVSPLVTLAIASGAAVTAARSIGIDAVNRSLRTAAGQSVRSGSGGIVDLPATRSRVIVEHETGVSIGAASAATGADRHTLYLNDTKAAPGTLRIDVLNEADLRDAASLDSGGAISVARSESGIDLEMLGEIRIVGASVATNYGGIRIGARSDADVSANAAAKTYGGAGAAQGKSRADVDFTNRVTVGDGALVSGGSDVALYAGRDTSGLRNRVTAKANTDLFNKTAFPIETSPTAAAVIAGLNEIVVSGAGNSGAEGVVRAVGDVALSSLKGSLNAAGLGVARDLYRQAAEDFVNGVADAFGAENVSFEERTGTSSSGSVDEVRVDGTVRSSFLNQKTVTIQDDIDLPQDFADLAPPVPFTSASGISAGSPVISFNSPHGFSDGERVAYKTLGDTPALVFIDYFTPTGQIGFFPTDTLSNSRAYVVRVVSATELALRETPDGPDLAFVKTVRNPFLDQPEDRHTLTSLDTAVVLDEVERSAGVDAPTVIRTNLGADLARRIAEIESQQQAHSINPLTFQKLEFQRRVILQQADRLGILQGQSVIEDYVIDQIILPAISVELGDIEIEAGRLTGTGTLDSPGDAAILVENKSPYYLIVGDMEIPFGVGGHILLNGASVNTNASVIRQNGAAGGAVNLTLIDATKTEGGLISVQNTYEPFLDTDPERTDAEGNPPPAPAMEIRGQIDALSADFFALTTGGSIIVSGNLSAGSINIQSGLDFILSDENFFHISEPRGQWDGSWTFINDEALDRATDGNDATTPRSVLGSSDYNLDAKKAGGALFARGNVFIDALVLNVNGTIQSGIADREVVFDDAVEAAMKPYYDAWYTWYQYNTVRRVELVEAERRATGRNVTDPIGEADLPPEKDLDELGLDPDIVAELLSYEVDNAGGILVPDEMLPRYGYLNKFAERTFRIPIPLVDSADTGGTDAESIRKQFAATLDPGATDISPIEGIAAYLDIARHEIAVDNVAVDGGLVSLSGQIISTGDAEVVDPVTGQVLRGRDDLATIRAVDGFGHVRIDNKTRYDTRLNNINTGKGGAAGIEGRIEITDNSNVDLDGLTATADDDGPITTTFTRVGNDIRKTVTILEQTTDSNGKPGFVTRVLSDDAQHATGRETRFQTTPGQLYSWITGVSTSTVTTTNYVKETAFADIITVSELEDFEVSVDVQGPTPDNPYRLVEPEGEIVFSIADVIPDPDDYDFGSLLGGLLYSVDLAENIRYLDPDASVGDVHTDDGTLGADLVRDGYTFQAILSDSDRTVVEQRNSKTEGWWIFSTTTYYLKRVETVGESWFFRHSVKADYPINIEFTGYDTGLVDVESIGDVTVAGRIETALGEVDITSAEGAILSETPEDIISTENLTLRAATGIGGRIARDDVPALGVQLTRGERQTVDSGAPGPVEVAGAAVDLVTDSGDLAVEFLGTGVMLDRATTGDGNVWIRSQGDIGTTGGLIAGNRVTLDAGIGGIGDFRTGATASARPVLADAPVSAIRVETGDGTRINGLTGGLAAVADGNIVIREETGDTGVIEVRSRLGDVSLNSRGDLYDANLSEQVDDRAVEDLKGALWGDLYLIEDVADEADSTSGQNTVTAHDDARTEDYRSYWTASRGLTVAPPPVGFAGAAVDAAADTIYLGGIDPATGDRLNIPHRITTGEAVRIAGLGGHRLTGLAEGQLAYAIAVSATEVAFAATRAEALAGTGRLALSAGTDPGLDTAALRYELRPSVFGAVTAAADPATGVIDLGFAHGHRTGDALIYRRIEGGEDITGLTDGTVYYATDVGETMLRLALTRADALQGVGLTGLDLDPGRLDIAGVQSDAADPDFATLEIDRSRLNPLASTQLVFTAAHDLATGDRLRFAAGGGGAAAILDPAAVYFAVRVDDTTLSLATSLAEAEAGETLVDLSAAFGTRELDASALQVSFDGPRQTITVSDLSGGAAVPVTGFFDGLLPGETITISGSGGNDLRVNVLSVIEDGATLAVTPVAGEMVTAVAGSGVTFGGLGGETGSLTRLQSTVTLAADHDFATGDAVQFTAGGTVWADPDDPAGTGLEDGQTYYVAVLGPREIALATTADDALGGRNLLRFDVDAAGADGAALRAVSSFQLARHAVSEFDIGALFVGGTDPDGFAFSEDQAARLTALGLTAEEIAALEGGSVTLALPDTEAEALRSLYFEDAAEAIVQALRDGDPAPFDGRTAEAEAQRRLEALRTERAVERLARHLELSGTALLSTLDAVPADPTAGLLAEALGTRYDPNYAYAADAAEIDSLVTGATWTEAELENRLQRSLFTKTVTDTTVAIEAPNIVGTNISLYAGGDIGRSQGEITVALAGILDGSVSDAALLALSTAERDDLTFLDAGGAAIGNPYADDSPTAAAIRIALRQDLDIELTGGTIDALANDAVFLGSETDINIDDVTGFEQVRIKGDGNIYQATDASGGKAVMGRGIVLEAADGSDIGTEDQPLVIQLLDDLFDPKSFSARATNIFVRETPQFVLGGLQPSDLRVDFVFAEERAQLETIYGSILDAFDDDIANIVASRLSLVSHFSVGAMGGALNPYLEVEAGTLDAVSAGVQLRLAARGATTAQNVTAGNGPIDLDVAGALTLGTVEALAGRVTIGAFGDRRQRRCAQHHHAGAGADLGHRDRVRGRSARHDGCGTGGHGGKRRHPHPQHRRPADRAGPGKRPEPAGRADGRR
ncbi:hypothetical protein ROA7023_02572 [Roseisalinus antarcticus]|uniref:Bifunctional hemolysin/adenylate cyclase n=1 Tax=Roseisalinus antarcticus TaxID=254357 RepID=A0A1Y5TBP0_9RHOB|nr:hypothetical protein ROA7023_02572 [Roseisalinus antarcticus]